MITNLKLSNFQDFSNAILTPTLTHALISKDAGPNKDQQPTELEDSAHVDAVVLREDHMMPDASITEVATTTHGELETHTVLQEDTVKKTTQPEDHTMSVQ